MVLKSSGMKGQFDAAQNGAAREGLNFAQISKLALAVPPAAEQLEITAIPQLEENEVLTNFLQRGGGGIWTWAIAGFSGRKLFPEQMLSHEIYPVEATSRSSGGAIPESQSCCHAL
jgi:hypothetical protein